MKGDPSRNCCLWHTLYVRGQIWSQFDPFDWGGRRYLKKNRSVLHWCIGPWVGGCECVRLCILPLLTRYTRWRTFTEHFPACGRVVKLQTPQNTEHVTPATPVKSACWRLDAPPRRQHSSTPTIILCRLNELRTHRNLFCGFQLCNVEFSMNVLRSPNHGMYACWLFTTNCGVWKFSEAVMVFRVTHRHRVLEWKVNGMAVYIYMPFST